MKNKVALIFGSTGQDGVYLNNLLQQQHVAAINVSRTNSSVMGDVGDRKFVDDLIKENKPDYIFHLAANSTVRHDVLFENHKTICNGTLNILESTRLYCPSARVFLSGSALQFRNEGLPINENTPFEATSPYAVARIQSVYAARYFRQVFELQVYVGYFFNHDSPFRAEHHVNQKIVKAAKRIAQGSKEKLVLGNIGVQKEFNYAGDVVQAVWMLVNQQDIFEAVIGGGKAYRILDWLSYCFKRLDLKWEDAVVVEENYVSQYEILVSDPKLIMSLGWRPRTDIYELANMMLNE